MGSKREEERNEKIIRGLMKLPPNRRCINCNSLGPQYVCTTFWTFVCMTCSGIHREFTHRVKSVSMSKFTSQEVDALQKGGNQRARELFLKAWDPQNMRLTDNSTADKVREFIKNVYVEKRYVVEKSLDRPPKDPQGVHGLTSQSIRSYEDETRRANSYHSYSQSPPYDFQYEERRYGKHAASLTRKPGSDRGLYEAKFSSFSSPSRFSDHANDEGFANEGSHPRVLQYSASNGSDPFRSGALSASSQRDIGSPFSETSSNFSNKITGRHTVRHNSDSISVSEIRNPQITASAGSTGSFDSMSLKSVNCTGLQQGASEPEKSVEMFHDKTSSFPSLPQSSNSTTFSGLDLFNEPVASQNVSSTPVTVYNSQLPGSSLAQSVDLFQKSPISSVTTFSVQQPFQTPQPSSLNINVLSQQQSVASSNGKTSDVITLSNGAWETFETPQNLVPMGTENSIPAAVPSAGGNKLGDFNPFPLDRSLSSQNAASEHTLLHEGIQNVETTRNNTQLWTAFEDSPAQQPMQNLLKSRGQNVVLCAPDANRSLGFGVYEALDNGGNVRMANEVEPLSSLSSHFNMVLHDFPVAVAGLSSVAADCKPTNPFDLPYDADLESSYMTPFRDMSSLQAALPNNQMMAPYNYVSETNWFPQNSVPPYVPGGGPFDPSGSLGYIVGQVPSNQILSTAAQNPVTSTGGNPFA
ncbi:putative ADP-ribosylation factor GTPase-activating protein AGD14 [Sesamum alatum]|uniref:ADP-ribosylation factor GTPase-activating protein AGD14 n=1 Tax=Sesamum alatum TaxID=300844 RepID=A0AAE2CRM4_9LAMI|nr:putative ADP-ribosylation factor GTPase-activating protein AGD14 [Sesamum alatum]